MSCGNCTDCSNKCDTCINCDTSGTPSQCNTQQSFCNGSREKGQLASTYIGAAGAPNFARDDIIIKTFPQATLNKLIDYVGKAASYGKTSTSGSWKGSPETKPHIYSTKINELLAGIRSVGTNNPGPDKAKDKVILAAEFNTIMNTINNMVVGKQACDWCVSGCNVTCDTCNTCDSCIACNTCQGVTAYSSHYSSHYSSG